MKSQRYEMIDKFVSLFSIQALKYQRRNQQSISPAAKRMTGRWFAICLAALCLLLGYSLQPAHADTIIPAMTITQDTTFGPNAIGVDPDTVYIITGDVVVQRYNEQVTLTIEAGVELRFEPGTGMSVGYRDLKYNYNYYGAVVAQGTPEAPIRFTSNAVSPQPGDWKGLFFQDATLDNQTVLEYCIIEYGGQTQTGYGNQTHQANLTIERASFLIQNTILRHSSAAGLRVFGSGSQAEIRGNTIEANGTGIEVTDSAMPTIDGGNQIQANSQDGIAVVNGASPVIEGNTITSNGQDGIAVDGAAPTILNNTISTNPRNAIHGNYNTSPAQIAGNTLSDNGGVPISISANGVKNIGNNAGSGNGEDVIEIYGGTVSADGTWKKLDAGAFPYVITGDVVVQRYNEQVTLTIEAGVELRFEPGTGMSVGYRDLKYNYNYYGAVVAQGTPEAPIRFTSNAVSPQPGDWKGLFFQDATLDD